MLPYPSQYSFHLSPVIIHWLSVMVLIIDWAVVIQGSYGNLWSCLCPFLWLVHSREPKLCKCSTVGYFFFGKDFVWREANQYQLLPLKISITSPAPTQNRQHPCWGLHSEHLFSQWITENDNVKKRPVTNSCSLKSKHTWLAFQRYLRN